MFKNAAKIAAKVGVQNCLQLEVGPRDECLCPPNWIRPLSIVPGAVARDPRVQAHVSYDEAVIYVRGVNARIANHRSCWYKPFLACFVIGAAVFGGMMGAFHEEPRIRCKGRVCERGEDPLVAGCCMFWCCGQEMKADKVRGRRLRGGRRGGGGSKGGKKKNNVESSRGHKLKTRPYDRWDVWANETYFDDTERCTPYEHDYTVEKKGKLDEKRDAAWACDTCPAFLLGTGMKCRTMVEGKARRHETAWPLFLLIPFLLPLVLYFTVACTTLTCQAQLLYKKAFEEWRARGVITHVEFQRGGKHSPHYLRLWFPPGQAVPTANPVQLGPGWSAHQNIDMCGQGDVEVIHNWRGKHVIEELMRKVEQNGYSAVCVGSFGHAALKKFPYQLTAGHCKPSSGYTNTLYIWSGGGSGLTEDLEARSRGIRDGDTILLQCQSSGWSRSANNWLGFDGSNFMRCGSGATQKAVPLTLHAVSGQPHTYTIEHKGGWLGRDGFDMKANQPREHAARVRFDLERFEQTGRVILLCVDNNMIISHRDKGGWMVARYPVGTQGVDYHLVVTLSGKAVPAVEETVGESEPAPPPLHDIVDALKKNLGLDGTWPEVVDAACLQLGVAPTGSLQEKADECWRAMEG